jgi:hypothetical protein
MFNYLKRWEGKIGELRLSQTAQPFGDGDEILIVTTFAVGQDGEFHGASIRLPFADAEKLADEKFRAELARKSIAEEVGKLHATVVGVRRALGLPHLVEASAS